MPKQAGGTPSPIEVPATEQDLLERLAEAEDRTLEYWLEAVTSSATGSMTVKAMQQSASWRLTRPLRAGMIVYRRIRMAGFRKTFVLVKERLAQIRQAKKRG